MLRNLGAIAAALMVCLPIGGGVRSAMGSYLEHIHGLRPIIRWAPGAVELALLCACLVILCLVAPRFRT